MPRYKLLVASHHASVFGDLKPAASPSDFGLQAFTFEAEAPTSVRQRVLDLNRAGVTCFCLPQIRWKAAFFDMDSTAIAEESIVELARAAGKVNEVAEITERAMAGELDFKAALLARVAMLEGQAEGIVAEVGARLTINPGLEDFARVARAEGVKLYLVSGGFRPLASIIVSQLKFDGFAANELASAKGRLSGGLVGPIIDAQAKADFMRATCQAEGIDLSVALAVGDGANDLPMLRLAGSALGYCPKQVLLPEIDGAIYDHYRALIPACFG